MSYIRVRGFEHYYEWIRKPAASKNKPVMVFIHGWAGSLRYWQSTANALADTFDCLLYDMRGFGRSVRSSQAISAPSKDFSPLTTENLGEETPAASPLLTTVDGEKPETGAPLTKAELTYELEEYADDLAALLDALQLNRVYINAHSMGASVATFFLNMYPEKVERAILTCSGIFEYDEKAFTTFHKFGGYVVKFRPRWLGKIPFMDTMFMKRFLHRPLPRTVSSAFLEDFLIADYEAALNTIFTSVSKKAAEVMPAEFAKLKVPTLIVAGERDIIIPAAMGQAAAALNDVVEYTEIANTAHFPMLEDPETYLERVREFLEPSGL